MSLSRYIVTSDWTTLKGFDQTFHQRETQLEEWTTFLTFVNWSFSSLFALFAWRGFVRALLIISNFHYFANWQNLWSCSIFNHGTCLAWRRTKALLKNKQKSCLDWNSLVCHPISCKRWAGVYVAINLWQLNIHDNNAVSIYSTFRDKGIAASPRTTLYYSSLLTAALFINTPVHHLPTPQNMNMYSWIMAIIFCLF